MKQFLGTACLTIVALIGVAQISEAHGLFRRSSGCCGTPVAAPCAAPCATTVQTPAPAPAPAPAPQFTEQKVKVYKNVWKDKEIEVLECSVVTTPVKYNYTISVPVYTDAKRLVTYCTPVSKVIDVTYTVLVPKTMQKEVNVTTYNCVTENIVQQVPVCRTVCVQCVDACGRCYTQRQTVTEMQNVTRCVVKRIPVVSKQLVNYTVCEPVQQAGKRTVCEIVRTQKEEIYKVCSFKQVQQEGTRMVCSTVTNKVKRMVKVCEVVVTEETIRVPVCQPCSTPCATPCTSCGSSSHRAGLLSGGLFRRGSGCCN